MMEVSLRIIRGPPVLKETWKSIAVFFQESTLRH